jgi:hypothetical protein
MVLVLTVSEVILKVMRTASKMTMVAAAGDL